MLTGVPTVPAPGGEPLLYVAELLHRVSNECASAISFASAIASRASSPEAKSALKTVIEHLVQLASAHRVLLPSVVDGTADPGDDQSHLTRVFTGMVGVSPGAWRRALDQ
jgi:two-component sensor histidine kinase